MKSILKKLCIIGVITVLLMSAVLLCACNMRDYRNPRNGEPESGEFYSLQTAYDNGWLSKVDLQNIAYYHNVPLYDPFGESLIKGFKPTLRTPEALSEETEDVIIKANFKDNEWLIDYFKGVKYYGTYDGFIALFFNMEGHKQISEEIIGGVKFIYDDWLYRIVLWKE